MRKLMFRISVGLLWIVVTSSLHGWAAGGSGAQAAGSQSPSTASIFGEWKEYWGIPGQTDVTYHDAYRITRGPNGSVLVKALSGNEPITEIRLEQGHLTFNQRTFAFVVRYSLTFQPDGRWLSGTATTPVKTYPIKWERTKGESELAPAPTPAPPPPPSPSPSRASDAVFGEWKEYWGIPGQTDVTYHDEYRISPGVDGKVKVQILSRNQVVESERLDQNRLTFVHHTDSYAVKYDMTLQPAGQLLMGTATTPVKSYPVKWERLRRESAVESAPSPTPFPAVTATPTTAVSVLGEWKEHWGIPGQTDVTYSDEYRVFRDADGKILVEGKDGSARIDEVRVEGMTLNFTQHTAFAVKYSLIMNPNGQWMSGSATTPVKVVPIIWERTKEGEETPSPMPPGVSLTSFVGDWSEHWGTPGQTDVNYHDQYRISSAGASQVKVRILNRNQVIENERVEQNRLTFTQHTDTYLVKYVLTLQVDGQWLVGTAATPNKVEQVKWERVK